MQRQVLLIIVFLNFELLTSFGAPKMVEVGLLHREVA